MGPGKCDSTAFDAAGPRRSRFKRSHREATDRLLLPDSSHRIVTPVTIRFFSFNVWRCLGVACQGSPPYKESPFLRAYIATWVRFSSPSLCIKLRT